MTVAAVEPTDLRVEAVAAVVQTVDPLSAVTVTVSEKPTAVESSSYFAAAVAVDHLP